MSIKAWGGWITVLAGASLSAGTVITSIARAESTQAAESVSLSEERRFDIRPQPLSAALKEFANQAGLQIMFSPELVGNRTAPAVRGERTSGEALRQLLKGTGLDFVVEGTTIAVRPAALVVPAASTSGNYSAPAREADYHTIEGNLRLAQADQGSSAVTVGQQPASSEGSERQSPALEEVLVTAQKREQRLQDVPISMTVLSTEQLESPYFQSATDVLNTVPGVATFTAEQGGGTQVSVRGVGPSNPLFEGSSPIAYYLDGVPFGLVKSSIAPDENIYDLKQVEVLRGPQGTLYGASALNGVVRILTNDADLNNFDLKARISDSGTQNGGNNYRGDMAINVPIIPGQLALRAVAGYEKDAGWIDSTFAKGVNTARLSNYRLKLNAQPTPDLSIGVSAWSSRSDYGAPNTANDNYQNLAVAAQPLSFGFDTYGLKLGYDFHRFTLTSQTSYLDYNDAVIQDLQGFFGFPSTIFTGLASHVFSEEFVLNSAPGGPWRWSVGAMYRRATEGRWQYITNIGYMPNHNLDISKSLAEFGELTRLFLDGRLELTAGFRHFEDEVPQWYNNNTDDPTEPIIHSEGKFNANTPRAVVTWHMSDHSTIYGSFSEGFRSGFPQDATVPLPPVNADKLYNYELGAKGSLWDNILSYDVALYYLDWQHVQQPLTVLVNNIPSGAVLNGGAASGPGLDFTVGLRPIKNLTLAVNASWNKLEVNSDVYSGGVVLFSKGGRLNSSPEYTFGASADYVIPLGGSGLRERVSASANYVSRQNNIELAGNDVVNYIGDSLVNARVSLATEFPEHWTAMLFIDNLTDDRGTPYRNQFLAQWDARVRPRTIGLQLDYRLAGP